MVKLQFTAESYTVNEGDQLVQLCVEIINGVIVEGVRVPFAMETLITNTSTAEG